jgi:hypothetical protein
MTTFSTTLSLSATAYIYTDDDINAAAILAQVIQSDIDVAERGRFLQWIGDGLAVSPVHFCSSMTILGLNAGAAVLVHDPHEAQAVKKAKTSRVSSGLRARTTRRSNRFAVDLKLTVPALMRAENQSEAIDLIRKRISTAITVDDKC